MIKAIHEEIVYKKSTFPLSHNRAIHHQSGDTPPHGAIAWHEDIEIKIFRKGSMSINVDNSVFDVCEGDIIIINPYEIHQNLKFYQETYYESLIFNVKIMLSKLSYTFDQNNFTKLLNGGIKINRILRKNDKFAKLFDMLVDEFTKNSPEKELALVTLTLYILTTLLREQSMTISSDESIRYAESLRRLEPLTRYIKENIGENLSLQVLADVSSFNPKYLSYLFKKTIGLNLNEYIAQLRLIRAQELLSSTDKKIGSIALELGFMYENYFIRWFKKLVGITPSVYRAGKD